MHAASAASRMHGQAAVNFLHAGAHCRRPMNFIRAVQFRQHGRLVTSIAAAGTAADLEEWFLKAGGKIAGVKLHITPDVERNSTERQLLATQNLQPGQLLISVPRACQLRYDAIDDPNLLALFEKVPRGSSRSADGGWQFQQALTLLWHVCQGAASPLHAYLMLLPGLAPGVPTPRVGMLLADDAVQELQYMPIIDDVLNQKYWWDQFTSTTLPDVQSSDKNPFPGMPISKEAFGWAVAVTNSRTFGLSRSGSHTMPALIDMIDHDPENSNCEVRSDEHGAVNLSATKQIQAGDQLRLSYGKHDNRNMLLSYGFVSPGNPSDKFEFEFDKDSIMALIAKHQGGPGLASWQEELLRNLGLTGAQQSSEPAAPGSGADVGGAAAAACDQGSATSEAGQGVESRGEMFASSSTSTIDPPGAQAIKFAPRVYLQSAVTEPAGKSDSKGRLLDPDLDQQPVEPRLLAALRVMTLQGDAAQPLVASLTLDQLGDWARPLARQHEVEVLKLLTRLCTALYQSLGTTLQQDSAVQQQLQVLVTAGLQQQPASLASGGRGRGSTSDNGNVAETTASATDGAALASLDVCSSHAASASAIARDVLLAVQYRMSIKRCLERALQTVIARSKELEGL